MSEIMTFKNWKSRRESSRFRIAGAALAAVLLCAGFASRADSGIVINEIHYDPDIKTEFVEFVEL